MNLSNCKQRPRCREYTQCQFFYLLEGIVIILYYYNLLESKNSDMGKNVIIFVFFFPPFAFDKTILRFFSSSSYLSLSLSSLVYPSV